MSVLDAILDSALRQSRRPVPNALRRVVVPTPNALLGAVVQQSNSFPVDMVLNALTQARHPTARARGAVVNQPDPGGSADTYRPTLDERVADAVYDAGTAMGLTSTADRMRREVDLLPGIGDVVSALQGVTDIGRGNYWTGGGEIGLAALGAIPGVGDAAAATIGQGARRGIRAFHGSPHAFDRFELSPRTIGTGEGAQAYGHGLYFAENEDVARGYRDKLADGFVVPRETLEQYYTPGRIIPTRFGGADEVVAFHPGSDPWDWAVSVRGVGPDGTPLRGMDGMVRTHSTPPRPQDLNTAGLTHGSMYEVDINADPSSFLDWDRPLGDQPALSTLLDIGTQNRMVGGIDLSDPAGAYYRGLADAIGPYPGSITGAEQATQVLAEGGVPGIRFLDQGSRGAGTGTSNYVLFDDSLIDIIRRYGLAGGTVGLGTLMALQQAEEGHATY